jgi:hypothetical protein
VIFRHTRVINRQTDSKRVLDRHAARQTRHTNKNARQTDILKRGLDRQTVEFTDLQTERHLHTDMDRHTHKSARHTHKCAIHKLRQTHKKIQRQT